MWLVIIITAILFIAAFPKFGLAVGIIIGIGFLFRKWANRFYFNFVIALFTKVIFEEVGKKIFIFKAIDELIKYVAKTTLLTKYFGNNVIDYDYFVVVAVFLTVTDILVSKLYYVVKNLYYSIMDKVHFKQTNNTANKNIQIYKKQQTSKKNNANSVGKIKKEKEVTKEKDLFDDLVFGSRDS